MKITRGVGICHFNRVGQLGDLIQSVKDTVPKGTRIVVCDDGSDNFKDRDETGDYHYLDIANVVPYDTLLIRGPNKGVAANKNRALWALQDCHFLCILEDDLFPIKKGWFEIYEEVATITNNHHFCRVQDREVPDVLPGFTESLRQKGYTPIFGPTPRGDLTFTTSGVVRRVGGFNPEFKGAGYAHGEWSNRVYRAGLIPHPNKWWDIREARDKFEQRGDIEGGRWLLEKTEVVKQIQRNKKIARQLEQMGQIYVPLTIS